MNLAATATTSPEAQPDHPAVELTVVIPTFEERGNIPVLAEKLARTLSGIRWEAIFVDDDSADGTAAAVRALGQSDSRIRCIQRIGRRGLAGACIEGMLAAQGACVAVMDADLQHDEALLPAMLETLRTGGTDLVIGSRYVADGDVGEFSALRKWLSVVASRLAQWILKLRITDPMSGFFMMRREAGERLAPKLSNQGFKLLMDILATSRGSLRVRELPYSFRQRLHGQSKLDTQIMLEFAGLVVSRATRNLLPIRFIGFGVVGATGLIVHLLALKMGLAIFNLEFVAAQAVATLIAMTSNFVINNALTYRDRKLRGVDAIKGLLLFYAICSVGAISNLGVANWIYTNRPIWWIAGLCGSLVGAVWNYVLSTEIVWTPHGRGRS